MVDVEDGFTFVDKRRTVAQESAEDAPKAADLHPADETPELDDVLTAAESGGADLRHAVPLDGDSALGSDEDDDPAEVWTLIQYCVHMLAAQSWQKLGLIADPRTGKVHRDLVQARVAIDVVGDLCSRLETAPTDILDAAARRELRNMVSDLRMNFVTQRGMAAAETSSAGPS